MPQAFINLSCPTSDPQEVSILTSDKFTFMQLSIRWKPLSVVGCAQHSAWEL